MESSPHPIRKGTIETSVSPSDVARRFYTGDGRSYNIDLTLSADGSYAAEWQGCLGNVRRALT